MAKLALISLIFATIYTNFNFQSVKSEDDSELLAVSLFMRHGDRTPWKFYTNDPYKNSPLWTNPPGELTNIGKIQHYNFGKWLRNRYANGDFLSDRYVNTDIRVRSSDYDRCLMSASANLAGFLPPASSDVWMEDFPWQPIPIHTSPIAEDDMIEVKDSCPIMSSLIEETEANDPYFADLDERNQELYAYVSEHSGDEVTSIGTLADIYDILFIETLKNFTLPAWTGSVFPDRMKETYDASFSILAATQQQARLFLGRFFQELKEQFQFFAHNATSNDDSAAAEKFRIFSGHDDQVFSILNVMNYTNLHAVPYASSAIFELRKSTNDEMFVNLFYKHEEDAAEQIEVGDCGLNCPLDQFIEILSVYSLTEDEWKEKCNA